MKKKWMIAVLAVLVLLLALMPAALAAEPEEIPPGETPTPTPEPTPTPTELGSYPAGAELECPMMEWKAAEADRESGTEKAAEKTPEADRKSGPEKPAEEEKTAEKAETPEEETLPEVKDLPDGLELAVRETISGPALFLTGKPMAAGSYVFTVLAEEEELLFSVDIVPAEPVVTVCGDVSCLTGETAVLSVTAETADEGTLSYQWYLEDGLNTAALEGENGPELRPDTSTPGTRKYCCEVTNTNNGETAVTLSDLMKLTVSAPEVKSVSIETMPAKMDYLTGEDFDPTGLSLRVAYNNGTEEIVREGYDLSCDLFNTPGTHTVRVSYGDYSWSFYVNVQKKEAVVSGIGVLTLPNKREYLLGDKLQTRGLSIRVYTDDGEHFDLDKDFECAPTTLNTEGEQTVTVRYSGKTCNFKVTVRSDKVFTGISVLTLPDKRNYTVGDYLDTTGLSIQLNSNKGSEAVSSGYTVSPKVLSTPGTQEITVRYEKFSTKFSVSVKAKESVTPKPTYTPRPTPTPFAPPTATPSASPGAAVAPVSAPPSPGVSPEPELTARPVTSPTRRNTGVNGVVKLFFALAVMALAGLAGYVWYLRKTGFDGEEAPAPDAGNEEAPAVYGEPVEPEVPKAQQNVQDPEPGKPADAGETAPEQTPDETE